MANVSDLEAPIRVALSDGDMLSTLGIAFGAGVATSLTPCVYPMIAITVSVFGARETKSRAQGALLSSAFVLGMAALFAPLGLAAAMTGGVFGAALASPPVLVCIALVFAALAASMFGAFELDLPSGLKTKLASLGGVGFRGAFVLGMVSALIAAPCTGPVLGALLTWVSSSRDLLRGGLALFSYALGLGLLFFMVGTFAVALPKSGRWLGWVKSVFGVVMLTAAVYYVRPLVPDWSPSCLRDAVSWLVFGSALTAVGFALGAIHLSFAGTSGTEQIRKALGIALCVAGLLSLVRVFETPGAAGLAWADDFTAARARARREQKPMLIDFSASWCGACGELDRHTFSDPEVVREARRFVAVRVDLSPGKDSADKRALLASYAQRGLPLVVLHDKRGSEARRVTGFVKAQPFVELLRAVE